MRIGYISPDFRAHPIGRFCEPLLEHHDRSAFEVFCYSDAGRPDDVTRRLRSRAEHWRETAALDDTALAAMIRADGIDILVDLAGHGAGNRLAMFARRAAPVQVAYLGYMSTTGLAAMDWRLTNERSTKAEMHYTERPWALAGGIWCYRPDLSAPEPGPPPMIRNGWVTFGCLNNLAKLTPMMLELWRQIIEAVPGSRLAIRSDTAGAADNRGLLNSLAASGLPRERVVLFHRTAGHLEHLRRFVEIDLSLDPFPVNGVTTTCDSLWMGVPVIGLVGRTPISRTGVSLLGSVGLEEECVATMAEEYVVKAVRLARDPDRLAALRNSLRPRMAASGLTDGPRLAREVEAAYRGMAAR